MQTAHTANTKTTTLIAPAALSEEEASDYVGFSREFLRQSRMHGRRSNRTPGPPFVKIGRAVRYIRADLDAWLARHRREVR